MRIGQYVCIIANMVAVLIPDRSIICQCRCIIIIASFVRSIGRAQRRSA
jgi:hypothetical protein